jgi:hypothetical protein
VVKQITNKLMRTHVHRATSSKDLELFDTYLADVKRNGGNLHFPPFFVHDFSNLKQVVSCESVTLTATYVYLLKLIEFYNFIVYRFIFQISGQYCCSVG